MKARKNMIIKYWKGILDQSKSKGANPIEHLVNETIMKASGLKATTYMITPRASELIDKINVDKIGLEIYKQVPNGIYRMCDMRENHTMIIIDKEEDLMTMILLTFQKTDKGMELMYTSIRVDLKLNCFRMSTNDLNAEITSDCEKYVSGPLKKDIAYLFLSDIKLIILPINGKHGTATSSDRLKNDSDMPLIIVTEKWNTVTMHIGDFGVGAHFAWRVYGPHRMYRRLVFINSYVKHGYKRQH